MDERERLVREEDEGWTELQGLVARLGPEQLEEPGMNEDGWTVKDLLFHLSCWWAEAAHHLERIRLGTDRDEDVPEDRMNARFLEEGRRESLADVEAQLPAARSRALQELAALPELSGPAVEWFEESGALHYREHLRDLRAWVERLTAA
ncbi:MAG: maleylpyruvate isomerase N-terminal domain-containing protein [Candidatus Velamenicoccus archaeovorus]